MSQGGPKPSAFYVERQLLTRLPATPNPLSDKSSNFAYGQNDPGIGNTNPGDGLVLAGLFSFVVSVYPAPGKTLSGAGSLLCWVYNPYQAFWTRAPGLDVDLSDSSGVPAYTVPAFNNISRLGMLINFLTSSVTVSGGADVLVRLDGFTSTGSRGT